MIKKKLNWLFLFWILKTKFIKDSLNWLETPEDLTLNCLNDVWVSRLIKSEFEWNSDYQLI